MCISQAIAAKEVLGSIGPAIKWGTERLARWQDHQDRIETARIEAQEATLKAQAELAAWKVKADVEWDLEWAKQAGSSWKDEYLTILFTLPIIGLFIPGIAPFVMEGFDHLRQFHPDAPTWYMGGVSVVVAATFGIKQALNFMLPGRFAALAGAMGALPDDIPQDAIKQIQTGTPAGKPLQK